MLLSVHPSGGTPVFRTDAGGRRVVRIAAFTVVLLTVMLVSTWIAQLLTPSVHNLLAGIVHVMQNGTPLPMR